MTCSAKHTIYQPTDEEWKCPKCGSDHEVFYIEDPANSDEDCQLLHQDDGLYCHKCDNGMSGKTFARKLQKSHNLIQCPSCKGKGVVAGVIE